MFTDDRSAPTSTPSSGTVDIFGSSVFIPFVLKRTGHGQEVDWIEMAHDRLYWWVLVNTTINLEII